jgi:hypothetical protein
MRKFTIPTTLLVFSLTLTACGGSAQGSNAAQAAQRGGAGQNGPGGRSLFGNQDPNAPLPLASALAVGTIKLDTTAQAVTPDEANKLIPLWQGLQSLMSSDTAAKAEVEGVINQIQSTMTTQQVSAIKAMNLKGSDEASVFQQGGFAFGGPNAQGTPPADATPGAHQSRRDFRGRFGGGGDGGGFAFRGGGFGGGPGGPGGFNGGGLPGAGGSGGTNGSNSAAQSQRATAQARFTQFEALGVNPVLVRFVINYLQGLNK